LLLESRIALRRGLVRAGRAQWGLNHPHGCGVDGNECASWLTCDYIEARHQGEASKGPGKQAGDIGNFGEVSNFAERASSRWRGYRLTFRCLMACRGSSGGERHCLRDPQRLAVKGRAEGLRSTQDDLQSLHPLEPAWGLRPHLREQCSSPHRKKEYDFIA
jgi:hypothetical protein